ncbi:MAG: putative quinol monooxygenase [Myxococcota bacterium]|jgi:quinol monooxygenase YgiN|nr:putative quinol monooxygenase [Myxococcota bacterium]
MILITSTVTITPEHFDDAVDFSRRHVAASRLEAGCLTHQYFEDPEQPRTLVFLEAWKDQAAIDFHFAQSYSQKFATAIKSWSEGPAGLEIHTVSETKRLEL